TDDHFGRSHPVCTSFLNGRPFHRSPAIGQNNEHMFYSAILHDITNSKRCKEKAVQNQYEGCRKSVWVIANVQNSRFGCPFFTPPVKFPARNVQFSRTQVLRFRLSCVHSYNERTQVCTMMT